MSATWMTPEAGRATYITGDVRDVLADMPDDSVDLVMTSPPFLALRSYLPADHPDKHREIGAEPDPAGFLSTLLGLTAEWRRVLAPHGSIAVELGDTYSGSGGGGGDYLPGGIREGQQQFAGSAATMRESNAAHWRAKNAVDAEWPLAKSMCGIPHLYHLSLAYGRNILTGEESPAGKWLVRNVVAWCRPNPPVGALGDKFRPATSYMTIATPSPKRYFDLDAVRTAHKIAPEDREPWTVQDTGSRGDDGDQYRNLGNPAGAPPLDYWVIPTAPYSGSHYAVYPPALIEKPIKAMTPTKVCTTCGEPSRRINVDAELENAETTIGWSECECPDDGTKWRPGIVLDPFAGSGTTLAVATGQGHAAIGIDIDERNIELARDRVGPMFLDEATFTTAPTVA